MIEKLITYDHMIDEQGRINIRTITRIMEEGKELSIAFHRKVVDPAVDDISNEDDRTQLLGAAIGKELSEIREGLADAAVVSEGETIKGEMMKKETWTQKLSSLFNKPYKRTEIL